MMDTMLLNLGVRLANTGDLHQAETVFRQALQLNPTYAKAYSNLGFILYKQNRFIEAESCLNQAIQLDPNLPDARNNLSLILIDTGRLAEAETHLRTAIRSAPHLPEIHNNLALVLEDTHRLKEAERLYRRAVKINSNYAAAHYNLGNFLKRTNRLDEAERSYSRAIQLRPEFDEARFALATLYLLQGLFEQGWANYNELRMIKSHQQQLAIRRWRGESLDGCSILLYHEQGLGDTLQFIRYVQQLSESAETTLWVQQPLERLMMTSYPSLTIHTGEQSPHGPFDFACPIPDLPMIFHTSQQTIPQAVPYLQVTKRSSVMWQNVLTKLDAARLYRVGVVWAGNPKHHNDKNRSIPFNVFRELFHTVPDQICWISLQVGTRSADLAKSPCQIFNMAIEIVDFADTASMIEAVDLVITIDSAVAHLAGALGKETWLMLPFAPDWRWQLTRKDSPWYPAMRLFRQKQVGNWREVIKRIKLELVKQVKARQNPLSVGHERSHSAI